MTAYIVVKEYRHEGSSNEAVFSQSHLAEECAKRLRESVAKYSSSITVEVQQFEIDQEPMG